MIRLVLSLLTALLALTGQAGNVKIVNTQPAGVDFDFNGMTVAVDVQLQMSNIGTDECGLLVLVKNERWNDANLTFKQLGDLCEKMCVGDAELDGAGTSTTTSVPIVVPIERQFMTGKTDTMYMKAYVVNIKQKTIMAKGELVKYHPDTEQTRQQMVGKATNIAAGIAGSLMSSMSSGGRSIPDGYKACSSCSGTGKCSSCGGRGNDCSSCNHGECRTCNGKGYVGKDMMELMMEDDKKGSQNNAGKSQQNSSNNPLDDLFEGIFGF
mgnify:CR=1 FL=1